MPRPWRRPRLCVVARAHDACDGRKSSHRDHPRSTVAALLVFVLRTRLGVRVGEAVLWAGSAFGGSTVVVLGALVFVSGG